MIGIYAICRKDSDECYIGSAVDVTKRWGEHRGALRRGKHHAPHMQHVHDKHGMGVFEFAILETVADKARLIEREQVWLDCFSPAYNTAKVAGSQLGFKHGAETRARISAANRARSAETRQRMSAAQKARPPASDETRQKISEAGKGRRPSAETLVRMAAAHTGRRHSAESRARMSVAAASRPPCSDETRERLSAAAKGISDETRQKMSAAQRGRKMCPEATAKSAASRRGQKRSDEARQKMSASGKARCARERIHRSLAA